MERPRILLADDHAEFLAVVIRLIGSEYEVIRTFDNGLSLVDEALQLDADLLVLDISMPRLCGIDAALQLRAAGSDIKIVFLTVHADQDYLRSALAAGALGYVMKDRLATDLLPALTEVIAGRRFISPSLVAG